MFKTMSAIAVAAFAAAAFIAFPSLSPQVEAGTEAIVMTASGCGTMVKEFGHLLKDDPAYAVKAARIICERIEKLA